MVKQQYPHFNPDKHEINVRLAKVRTSSHNGTGHTKDCPIGIKKRLKEKKQ